MRYRVVQLADGTYQCQFRELYLWWTASSHAASADKEEQIAFAKFQMTRPPPPQREVWPRQRKLTL